MNSQDFLLILLLPEKLFYCKYMSSPSCSYSNSLYSFVPCWRCIPNSRVYFPTAVLRSWYKYVRVVLSSCHFIQGCSFSLEAQQLHKCLQSVWWSLQHSEGHIFYFLTVKASPSKILLLNKSPLLAFFSWQLWFECKKQSLNSITNTFFLLHSAVTGIDKDSAVSRVNRSTRLRAYLENSEVQSSANLPCNIRRKTNTSNSTWT